MAKGKNVVYVAQAEYEQAVREASPGVEVRLRGGRPTRCTLALLKELSQIISTGVHPNDACRMLGIDGKSRLDWLGWGRDPEASDRSIFRRFVEVMEGSPAFARAAVGARLHQEAMQGSVQAAQLWMRYFDRYGNTEEAREAELEDTVIEFDGGKVFGGKELDDDEPEGEEYEGVMRGDQVEVYPPQTSAPPQPGLSEAIP